MAKIVDLLQTQNTIGQDIQSIIRNFKKDSQERKTKSAYFQDRLRALTDAWDQFEENDNRIRLGTDLPMDHPYFANDYYTEILDLVKTYTKTFQRSIEQLEAAKLSGEKQIRTPPSPSNATGAIGGNATEVISSSPDGIVRNLAAQLSAMDRMISRLVSENSDQPREYYRETLTGIKQLWRRIEDINAAMWEHLEDPKRSGHDLQRYIALEDEVQQLIVNLSVKAAPQERQQGGWTPTTNGTINVTTLPLPKVTIPKFDGDYLKWCQFFDLFKEMVHNQQLSKVQKMWYLKSNISGEAENLIRHLSLSETNYDMAWTILQDRYNNERVLVSTLVQKILQQPVGTATVTAIKNLHDTTHEWLLALNNLEIDTSTWDPLLLPLLLKKVDHATHVRYEQTIVNPRAVQKTSDFLKFLEGQFQSMEAVGYKVKAGLQKACASATTRRAENSSLCSCCNGTHPIFRCQTFQNLTPKDRFTLAQRSKLCINCLNGGHIASNCPARSCFKCNKKHNTLLHFEASEDANKPGGLTNGPASMTSASNPGRQRYVLLSTARVKLIANNGREVECRAILDSGSQVNVFTEKIVRQLGISPQRTHICIQGIGKTSREIQQRVNVTLQSRLNNFTARLETFVLPNIIAAQPSTALEISNWQIPKNIPLADPNFNIPEKIDLLLGAEFYHQFLSIGQIKMGDDLPTLQNTVFGWVLAGKIGRAYLASAECGIGVEEENLNSLVERFWKLEEASNPSSVLSKDDKRCEALFAQHTTKTEIGRFMVKLPFCEDKSSLGESRNMALNRFHALERRLARDNVLKQQYVEFMDDYESLGHMSRINTKENSVQNYVIPHHCVLKPDSSTTKLRVVFDASAKTSSGMSLNDILYTGPKVQSELFAILLRFRLPKFVFCTDIQKMYRQILVHPDDRRFQTILWRRDQRQPVELYQLNTITYGTRAAPYLATKCLQQLALEWNERLPLGARALRDDFYVDDGLTGANSLNETIKMKDELNEILEAAGFKLRKWCANHPKILGDIAKEDKEIDLDFDNDFPDSIKALGLMWQPKTDNFCIRTFLGQTTKVTKRTVTSDMAKLFDPLGLIAPVIVTAKIFVQELWLLKLTWDEALPAEQYTRWTTFRKGLQGLDGFQITRHMFNGEIPTVTQLHVFADASEKAYGAAAYLRGKAKDGRTMVRLLCSKSRISPLKRQTLPRLELCAAVLAAELSERVRVADIKTASGVIKRPIHRLAPLFPETTDAENGTEAPLEKDRAAGDESPQEALTEIPTKRAKRCNSLTALLMIMLTLPTVFGEMVTFHQLQPDLGLYFEGIGSTSIVAADWKILIYYDLQPMQNDFDMLTNGSQVLHSLCQEIHNNQLCTKIVDQFNIRIKELQLDWSIIPRKRQRRGALNIVGNIANSLFGVLDSEYANHIAQTIKRVKEDEDHLLNLYRNQTSILDSTINLMKQDQTITRNRFDKFDDLLNQVTDTQNDDKYQLNLLQTITTIHTQLILTMMNLQRVQDTLLDVFIDTHHGKISPKLLSPQQLLTELRTINAHLPSFLELPVEVNDLVHLYQLMKVQGGVSANQAVFSVTLPLVDQKRYDLFKILPIPTLVNKTMIAIKPCAPILAINGHHDQYFPMEMEALRECQEIIDQHFLCYNIQSQNHKGSSICSCEFGLFINETQASCSFDRISHNVTWTQMNNNNQWIVSTIKPTRITAICGKQSNQLSLQGAGILQLQPTCIVKQDRISIHAQQSISTVIRTSYLSFGQISEIATPVKLKKVIEAFNSSHYEEQQRKLSILQDQLSQGDIFNLPHDIKLHTYHTITIGYASLALSLVVAGFLFWKKRQGSTRRNYPQPAPRSTIETSEFAVRI